MYHVIAVDDEIKALERFERLAGKEPRISDITSFTNPEDAIEHCKKHKADIAFLDIDMPKIRGLRLAGILREYNPYLTVVFVTAYDQYALDAFRVHAYDYLLKPIGSDDIKELFDRLDLNSHALLAQAPDRALYVQCFGSFICYTNQVKSARIHFRTAKAEELFALLLQYNAVPASRDQLIDKLWPDAIPEKAANYFRVTCTYLRKALKNAGFEDIIQRDRDNYMLNKSLLNCDTHLFIELIEAGRKMPVDYIALEKAANLYTAPYLQDRPYEWSGVMNQWLENEYKLIQNMLANELLRQGNFEQAIARMKALMLLDPYDEDNVYKLISIQQNAGDTTAAIITYDKYSKMLWKELNLIPSEKLQRLVDSCLGLTDTKKESNP
jgi:two-component SAPR family response regulator